MSPMVLPCRFTKTIGPGFVLSLYMYRWFTNRRRNKLHDAAGVANWAEDGIEILEI